jgi:hypothetical protein
MDVSRTDKTRIDGLDGEKNIFYSLCDDHVVMCERHNWDA